MAASLGTAVHASIEDLLLTDYSHIGNDQDNWLPKEGERLLKSRWEEEKGVFMNTPRTVSYTHLTLPTIELV